VRSIEVPAGRVRDAGVWPDTQVVQQRRLKIKKKRMVKEQQRQRKVYIALLLFRYKFAAWE
jgi:hypothetical protein